MTKLSLVLCALFFSACTAVTPYSDTTVFDKGVAEEETCHADVIPPEENKIEQYPLQFQGDALLKAWDNAIEGIPPWLETIQTLECGIESPLPPDKIIGWSVTQEEPIIYVIFYDRNGDKMVDADIEIYDKHKMPTFYVFDRTYNGQSNIIYYDEKEDGSCTGIYVFSVREDTPNNKPRENVLLEAVKLRGKQ